MKGTLFLVDGTALAYRSHFAFIQKPLTNSKGQQTSATFGYFRDILKILREEEPDFMAVAFDLGRDTFRKERFPQYKATRDKAPPEMRGQWRWIKELTDALGIAVLELKGYEADDLIGTAARRAEGEGLDVRIVSGDKDMMQLVSDRVLIYDTKGPALLGADEVKEKFGVPPDRVVDVMGLMGDSSDNVPGVPLVGPKKAAALVEKWGSLEEVLAHAPEGKPSKTQKNLVEYADQARLSRELVTIDTEAPVDFSLDRLHPGRRDRDRLVRLLTDELEFSNLLQEAVGEASAEAAEAGGGYLVAGDDALDDLFLGLRKASFFVLAPEASGPDPYTAEVLGIALSWKSGEATYVPWTSSAAGRLREILEDPRAAKGAHNVKRALHLLRTAGIEMRNASFDTMIASYLLDPGRGNHDLDTLALRHLGIRKTPAEALVGKGKGQIRMDEVAPERVADYAAEDADCVFRLAEFLRPRLEEAGLSGLFRDVEMPLVPVLAAVERTGVRIDTRYLASMSAELEETASRLVGEIHEIAGESFNVNSPKQLGPILFDKLAIHEGVRKTPKRTRTGGYATDAATLENYGAHPIVARLLEYRVVTKLRSTYVDALPLMIHPKTGRIHSTFHQTVAATGRLSSADPNLQNIPIRTELGSRIRRAFVTEEGWRILSADYSQIELRLMAHLSGDPGLCDVYERGGDVHQETAARMFGVPLAEVTREQRNSAKAINFGILYGMGPMRLARDLKITLAEGRAFLDAYFREFPNVRDFQKAAVESARRDGYVTTLLGRRRAIPEIDSDEPGVRANAENMAKNTPVQGTAADLIKVAMIRIHRRLEEEGFAARMILQVHDELVFECPAAEAETLGQMVRAEMEGALELKVPIVADVGVGTNWLEAH